MKKVFEYPSYEEANDRQNFLIDSGIPAKVERESTGYLEIYLGYLPRYHIMVFEEDFETATDLLRIEPDPDHVYIISCPKCGSGRVKEQTIDSGFGSSDLGMVLTLFIPIFIRLIIMNFKGRKMKCENCNYDYRIASNKTVDTASR